MNRLESLFAGVADWVAGLALPAEQVLFVSTYAEQSDYVRFNQGAVRQIGQISVFWAELMLYQSRPGPAGGPAYAQIKAELTLQGDHAQDQERLAAQLAQLQSAIVELDVDPYALFSEHAEQSSHTLGGELAPIEDMVTCITQASGADIDLVGFLVSGPMARGLVSSLGHRHFQSKESYFFDFSVYAGGRSLNKPVELRDKAVKQSLADSRWDGDKVRASIAQAQSSAQILLRPSKRLSPGAYRAWLAPAAVEDLVAMLSWGGFSASALRRGASPLERAYGGMNANPSTAGLEVPSQTRVRFAQAFNLQDAPGASGVPRFQEQGFLCPAELPLIEHGQVSGMIVSPRTGREYQLAHHGYGASEAPKAFKMGTGQLDETKAYEYIGTGLYISNLWYLNFSDRMNCSVTGMTRFASLWIEDGQAVAPLSAMRIDDSLYDIFGKQLLGLGSQAHYLAATDTYSTRSFNANCVPAALLGELKLTL